MAGDGMMPTSEKLISDAKDGDLYKALIRARVLTDCKRREQRKGVTPWA